MVFTTSNRVISTSISLFSWAIIYLTGKQCPNLCLLRVYYSTIFWGGRNASSLTSSPCCSDWLLCWPPSGVSYYTRSLGRLSVSSDLGIENFSFQKFCKFPTFSFFVVLTKFTHWKGIKVRKRKENKTHKLNSLPQNKILSTCYWMISLHLL